jgi:SPP1 gp7 family putative phage head morphogenesis protein
VLPKVYLTYGERRKRADSSKIVEDFDKLESAFLAYTQKLNVKRQEQLKRRAAKAFKEAQEAHSQGDMEEVEGVLKSITMPSSKEWRKGLEKLVYSSVRTGILRAYLEVEDIKKRYQFREDDHWEVTGSYEYEVVIPETARDFIRKHSYQLGVITEETVLSRIREALEEGLEEGLTPKEMTQRINDVTDTWVSDWHAQTIARTETGKFYNAGRIASWQDPELEGFVEAMQYDAILDSRTTDFCRDVDGKIISIKNQAMITRYTPPNHFQCRATWIPVSRFEEWEDNFRVGQEPESGFSFESPLPFLLNGKVEPLVKKVAKAVVTKITADQITDKATMAAWASERKIEVDFTKIAVAEQARIAQAVEKVFDEVPELEGFLTNLKDKAQVGRFSGEYAHAWSISKGISFNHKFYSPKAIEKAREGYLRGVQNKWNPAGTDFDAIPVHEMGHVLEYWFASNGIGGKQRKDRIAKEIKRRTMSELGLKNEDLKDELSAYALTDPSEFFAEAFAEALTSENPRRVASTAWRIMQEYIEEVRKR